MAVMRALWSKVTGRKYHLLGSRTRNSPEALQASTSASDVFSLLLGYIFGAAAHWPCPLPAQLICTTDGRDEAKHPCDIVTGTIR